MASLIDVRGALDRVDWDFPSAGGQARSIHSVHWFPGNFIPQIPAHLIQILSKPGDIVFDPFGGSGTTAIEALRLGRHAICSDLVAACAFIGSAKLATYVGSLDKATKDDLLATLAWSHLCETDSVGTHGEGSHPDLAHWYSARTLNQLRFLWKIIEQHPCAIRKTLELVFSDVLFACASTGRSKTSTGKIRRHHWGWVADNVHPYTPNDHDAIAIFRERIVDLAETASTLPSRDSLAAVIRQDARSLALKDSSVDLIVTSPPYIGVIDYTRANRLLYMWKGCWQLDRDRECEIGARYKRSRKEIEKQYLQDMRLSWKEMVRVLRPGGYCAVVIGESRKFPGTVTKTLADLAELAPMSWGPVQRFPTRRRVSDRKATDAAEFVSIFQKQ